MAPTTWTSTHSEAPDVLIIGAGISGKSIPLSSFVNARIRLINLGICTAIDLIRENKNIKFIIIEKGNQIGGTWNDNQYPGCCCDGEFRSLSPDFTILTYFSLESSLLSILRTKSGLVQRVSWARGNSKVLEESRAKMGFI
jgi:hypothetical protein